MILFHSVKHAVTFMRAYSENVFHALFYLTLSRQSPGERYGTRPSSGPGPGHRHPSAFAAAPGYTGLLLLLQEDGYRRVSNTRNT